MGKNPSMIFKDLCGSAKTKQTISKKEELTGIDEVIYDLTIRDKCFYVPYSDAIRQFLMEGYSEQRALKHLKQWAQYDLAWPTKYEGYKLLALADVI